MSWVGHVARFGRGEAHTGLWWGNMRERDHLEHLGVREDNIKMDLLEVGWGGIDWVALA